MSAKKYFFVMISLCLLIIAAVSANVARAENITPAQEQEFTDAKEALDAARKAQAENYAPAYIKQAQDFLKSASSSRSMTDAEGFSRASRLARAYADLAKAAAVLKADVDMLASTNAALLKAKAEIESLKKLPKERTKP